MNAKGFLARRSDGSLRMTKAQRDVVQRAVDAALHHAKTSRVVLDDLASVVARVVGQALAEYPIDRSCVTCDFEAEGFCHVWDDTIPQHAVDAGCDRHQAHGAPF